MITLYHGSNVFISKVDLSLCHPDKDFGSGFYLTDLQIQAENMAIRRTRITGVGTPTLTTFAFDESLLVNSDLKVKIFDAPNEEWALFVLANRKASLTKYNHDFDIVIGPIADDGVAFQLERYTRKLISLETLVNELTYRHLSKQYFFGTEKAISKLVSL